jgi:hypothetical protein
MAAFNRRDRRIRGPVIYPQQVRQQHRRGDEEHPAQPEHGGDRAAGQRPQRVAEKHRRGGDAVNRGALGPRDETPDQRIGGRQNAADEEADAEALGGERPIALGEGLRQGGQTRPQQTDKQHPAITDQIAPVAEKRGGNDIGEPGHRKGDAAQSGEVGTGADQLLDEQSHNRLNRAHPELRHHKHEK